MYRLVSEKAPQKGPHPLKWGKQEGKKVHCAVLFMYGEETVKKPQSSSFGFAVVLARNSDFAEVNQSRAWASDTVFPGLRGSARCQHIRPRAVPAGLEHGPAPRATGTSGESCGTAPPAPSPGTAGQRARGSRRGSIAGRCSRSRREQRGTETEQRHRKRGRRRRHKMAPPVPPSSSPSPRAARAPPPHRGQSAPAAPPPPARAANPRPRGARGARGAPRYETAAGREGAPRGPRPLRPTGRERCALGSAGKQQQQQQQHRTPRDTHRTEPHRTAGPGAAHSPLPTSHGRRALPAQPRTRCPRRGD